MFGDFSRRTFDSADGYRAVLLQQGRVVLDADVNEQAEITAYHDEVRTRDLVGEHGGPVGDGFAVAGPDGGTSAVWDDLRITEGRYYVDGMLCECGHGPDGKPWPITGQPMQPRTRRADDPSAPLPINGEPKVASLLYLDVWQRGVGTDEDPSLLESALGGADTAVRASTAWQLRTTPGDVAALPSSSPVRPAMVPRVTTDEGRVIDNHLYRIQVHTTDDQPALLWSRDNGSTVARLIGVSGAGPTGVLVVDRNGPDADRSFDKGQVVELTSTDLELARASGVLARISADPAPDPATGGITLTVDWIGRSVTLAALGLCPVLRGWDNADPIEVDPDATAPQTVAVDGGLLTLTFEPTRGKRFFPGDHWLVPVRTVALPYSTGGHASVDWPTDAHQNPVPLTPGPDHRYAPLAVLEPAGDEWKVHDCRRTFVPVTDLAAVSLHLLGGDGQEALPGDWLPYPVRVALRRGGSPVAGARIQFKIQTGELGPPLRDGTPLAGQDLTFETDTDGDGVAAVRWRLPTASKPTAHLLTASCDGCVPIEVTAQLSVADQVGWTAPDGRDCDGYATARTVQDVLGDLVTAHELALLGGDGQSAAPGAVLPAAVRVVVRAGGRALPGVKVTFKAPGGHLEADRRPTPKSSDSATPTTGKSGVASVRWLPDPKGLPTQTLTATLAGVDASVQVTAHLHDAAHTPWNPPAGCAALVKDPSVQKALEQLVGTPRLRVLGGDNQQVGAADEIAPHPVRVLVDNACGPLTGVPVFATPSGSGRAAPADLTQPRPATLPDPTPGHDPSAPTDGAGTVAFWWQPGDDETPTLRIHLGDQTAPLIVGATHRPAPPPGLHITAIVFDFDDFSDENRFQNDTTVSAAQLVKGIYVKLDGSADPRSWVGKPVLRVVLDLPWPLVRGDDGERRADGDLWFSEPIGVRSVELAAELGEGFDPDARPDVLMWRPAEPVVRWLQGPLWEVLGAGTVRGRFLLDGWAVVGAEDPGRHVSTHAEALLVDGRTDLRLPTGDEAPGRTFVQWFGLTQ